MLSCKNPLSRDTEQWRRDGRESEKRSTRKGIYVYLFLM